ncbi:hypothetical protein [Aliivibrio fischeri]|uniref:hypothetical protein n=1 Tax=Aliivibrio fischeri TaxID=668 RepID=UPI0007C5BA91|nr:hypothetical protein [Aliivibrio fischeri]
MTTMTTMTTIKIVFSAIFSGLMIPFGTLLTFKMDGIQYDPTYQFYMISFVLGFLSGGLISVLRYKKGPFDNWNAWSSLAHSNKLSVFVLIFTMAPLVIKTAKLVEFEKHLTPILYAYWFCGLFLFIFISVFKLISPNVYKYKSFEQFRTEANSILELREDALIALKSIDERELNHKLYESEKLFLRQDKIVLKKIIHGEFLNVEDAYSLLKKRLSYHNVVGRVVVALFILVPAYILPMVFLANILLVLNQAGTVFSNGTSFFETILGT